MCTMLYIKIQNCVDKPSLTARYFPSGSSYAVEATWDVRHMLQLKLYYNNVSNTRSKCYKRCIGFLLPVYASPTRMLFYNRCLMLQQAPSGCSSTNYTLTLWSWDGLYNFQFVVRNPSNTTLSHTFTNVSPGHYLVEFWLPTAASATSLPVAGTASVSIPLLCGNI